MDFLARREHSFYELQQKLQKKYPDADVNMIVTVLDVMQNEDLQSDERFAENFSRYRKSRGFGYRHIHADLVSRKVDILVIEKHLFEDDEQWEHLLQSQIDKRVQPDDRFEFGSKQHRRLSSWLESRGFSNRDISSTLKKYLT